MFGSAAFNFRCAFPRVIKCFLLLKNISNLAEVTCEKWFTMMTPLDMSREVTCHRLWCHYCFSNSIQFELIYFISIWTSQNLLKIRTFLSIRKRNKLFDHPSYMYFSQLFLTITYVSCNNPFSQLHVTHISRNFFYFLQLHTMSASSSHRTYLFLRLTFISLKKTFSSKFVSPFCIDMFTSDKTVAGGLTKL